MNINDSPLAIRLKVGLFTLLGIVLIGAITVFVNDRPFWWRPCQLVFINVEDATGLKTKSPIRSLGLQIGFLRTVELFETHVRLGICITAPVRVLDKTRAYIRGEGFLGDKFVELKPVKYEGDHTSSYSKDLFYRVAQFVMDVVPSAHAADGRTIARAKEVPVGESSQDVQQLVNQVNSLVEELRGLTTNVKDAINPGELKETMSQLNLTLQNAASTLSPQGNLTRTAQRALAKLEKSFEQLQDILGRINSGSGSIGMIINDPEYALELKQAIRNVNLLLSKVGGIRIWVDIGGVQLPAYDGARGGVEVKIFPSRHKYYQLGISLDPRGDVDTVTTTTQVSGVTTTSKTMQVNKGKMLLTGKVGIIFWDFLDLSLGFLHGDGAASAALLLGEYGLEHRLKIQNDIYARTEGIDETTTIHDRLYLTWFPSRSPYLEALYLTGGLETFRKVDGKVSYFFGAGIGFNDQDIKMLFSFL